MMNRSLRRAVALLVLMVMGAMGVAGLSAPPRALPTYDFAPKVVEVEMVELRFVPTDWWGIH